jgi:hypothetical protein
MRRTGTVRRSNSLAKLELKSEPELDDAGWVVSIRHGGNFPEGAAGESANRQAEVGMVKRVEEISPELQVLALAYPNRFLDGHIEADESGSAIGVSAYHTQAPDARCSEGGTVKGIIGIIHMCGQWNSGEIDAVTKLVQAAPVGILIGPHGEGEACTPVGCS